MTFILMVLLPSLIIAGMIWLMMRIGPGFTSTDRTST